MIYAPIEMTNVGKGAAVFVKVGLNRKASEHGYVMIPARNVNETFFVRVLAPGCGETEIGEYDLDVIYMDIYQNVYRQRYPFSIVKREDQRIGCALSFNCTKQVYECWDDLIQSDKHETN